MDEHLLTNIVDRLEALQHNQEQLTHTLAQQSQSKETAMIQLVQSINTMSDKLDHFTQYQTQLTQTTQEVKQLCVELGTMLQQQVQFEMAIRRYKKQEDQNASAMEELIETLTLYNAKYHQLMNEISASISVADKSIKQFLDDRNDQFKGIFDTTIDQLNVFFEVEQELFTKAFANAKQFIDEQELVSILDHLKHLKSIDEALQVQGISQDTALLENLKYLKEIHVLLQKQTKPDEIEAINDLVEEKQKPHNTGEIRHLYALPPNKEGVFSNVSGTPTRESCYVLTVLENKQEASFRLIEAYAQTAIGQHEQILSKACRYKNRIYVKGSRMLLKKSIRILASGEAVLDRGRWQIVTKSLVEFYD